MGKERGKERGKEGLMIVVGLGNPDLKYLRTRHNLGFMLIDRIIENKRHKRTCKGHLFTGKGDIYFKPLTYMNLSGIALKCLKKKIDLNNSDLLVCHDDSDLPLGTIRIKFNGNSGGHRGVESIVDEMGPDFIRLRMGISKPDHTSLEYYVLSDFEEHELETVDKMLSIAKNAVSDIINNGCTYAQQKYNGGNA